MAYIYKKIINGKPYYYLRVSKKVNGKGKTIDIAYLGSDGAKIQSKLDKVSKKYGSDIRKGYKTIKRFIDSNYYLEKIKAKKLRDDDYLTRSSLENIEALKLHFTNAFLKFESETIENTYKNFLVDFAYNTTSIEGNTITLEEANKLLRDDLTPKKRSLREIYDLTNTRQVFFELLEKLDNNSVFDQESIIKIHDNLVKNIDKRVGYRTHDIHVFKSHFESSPAKYVKTDMDILFKWVETYKSKMHIFPLVVLFHQKFEHIHPFSDGNGRTGRMVMNHMLMLNGYPPLIIQKKNRGEYLDSLGRADKSDARGVNPKHYKKLVNHIAAEYIESYWNNFNI